MFLKKYVQDSAMLVYGTPQPVLDTLDLDTNFVQVPTGTTTWFPFPQFLAKVGAEFVAPVAYSFMTDLNSSLKQQFFDVTVAKGKAMVQPHGVLDDASGKSVTIGLHISRHGKPAYPNLT